MAELCTSPMPCFTRVFRRLPTKEKRGFLLFLYGIWQIRFLSETAFRFELRTTSYLVDVLRPAQTKAVAELVSPLSAPPAVAEGSDKGRRGNPWQSSVVTPPAAAAVTPVPGLRRVAVGYLGPSISVEAAFPPGEVDAVGRRDGSR